MTIPDLITALAAAVRRNDHETESVILDALQRRVLFACLAQILDQVYGER